MRIATLVTGLALAVAQTSARSHAQTPASPAPSFEAATLKQNTAGDQGSQIRRQPGGRFSVTNFPARGLITFAYQLQAFQLQGGPDWLMSERWDIVAKIEGDPPPTGPGTPNPMMLALRGLLAERLKLVVHRETQELPIYALVLARPDGKLGPNIRPAAVDCQARSAQMAAAARGAGLAPPPPNSPDQVTCGFRSTSGRMLFGGMPLLTFANGIAGEVQRVVVDRTGLTGNWDFELTYTPERRSESSSPGGDAPPPDPNAASLFTAIQEQLGLKLESTKGPVEVTVIDRVERPVSD